MNANNSRRRRSKNVFLFLRNSIFVSQRQHWQCISLLLGAVRSLQLQSVQLQYKTWLWTGGCTNIFYLNLQSSFSHKVTMYIHNSSRKRNDAMKREFIDVEKLTVKFDSKFILLVFFILLLLARFSFNHRVHNIFVRYPRRHSAPFQIACCLSRESVKKRWTSSS